MAAFDPDAYLAKTARPLLAFDPDAYLRATQPPAPPPPPSGIPGPRQASTTMGGLVRGAASLADVTVGSVLPAAVQTFGYPVLRATGQTPEQAAAATQRMVQQVEQPFGRAFGVTETPEYQQEASRRLMDFIGQNFQKGAAWIAQQTGLPQPDVENMMGTAALGAPKAITAGARGVRAAAETPLAQDIRAGLQLPLEPTLQARRERLSAESYARGPQLDAAKEAQRLGVALNPTDIEPSAGTRFTTAVAGERGQRAIVDANKNRVRDVAIRDLDLPPTTQFNGPAAYNLARSKLSGPYEQVKQLPIQQADDALIQQLESIRADLNVIGAKDYAPAINKIVDDAIAKTQTGLTGATLLKNISVLRERARKTYNNKAATTEALDIADANLKVATALESMIDNSIFNPKLLSEFRDARQKMARTYAYEGATDFNTGVIDVSKLARITSKDNALTGDIAALGRIAGNFPDAFSTKVATLPTQLAELGRSGAAGTLGGLAGYLIGGDYLGAALGGVAGATAGRLASGVAAQRMVSPGYQAGLRVPDYRIPITNRLVEPPFEPPPSVVKRNAFSSKSTNALVD